MSILKRFILSQVGMMAFAISSHATLIQILHTNDLHAAVETYGAPDTNELEYGGWAQLKAVMDKLTADAKAQGIETVKLDAGDFTEGTSFYFQNAGAAVIRAYQHLGYDASAMGNHDWLMGAEDMDTLYGNNPFPFPVLSANVKIDKSLVNLRGQIVPSTQIERSGIKIGIFGLSTDEDLYGWIPSVNSKKNAMKIQDYRMQVTPGDGESGTRLTPGIANTQIQKLREDNDVVIALTHIGFEEDRFLAANSQGLDLIIGGHSHTFLTEPSKVLDKDENAVPIVQTGFNGKYVGKILLDVKDGERPKFVSYELIPVIRSGAKDSALDHEIQAMHTLRKDQFGNRLDEVIGYSEDRLVSGDGGPTSFSKFAADSLYEVEDTDFSLDIGSFHGNTPQPAGPVTRLNLMEMYPRKFETDQNEGLYVYKADIPGFLISIGLKYVIRFGLYVEMHGVTYDMNKMSDHQYEKEKTKFAGTPDERLLTKFFPSNIQIKGEPLHNFKWYTLSAPESLVRGALSLSPFMKLLIHRAHPTSHTIWDAMNFHLLKIHKIEEVPMPLVDSPWSQGIHVPRSFMSGLMSQSISEFKSHPVEAKDAKPE